MNSSEAEHIKKQLISNIESSFPKDKADILKRQIMSMDEEQLESFLEKSKAQEGKNGEGGNGCIFCSIASGNAESYKIGENDNAVAVLEINPVSRGHTIVISKEHLSLEKFPSDIPEFAKKIAEELRDKLSPKDVEIASVNFQGHGVINLIPVYSDESIKSERHRASKSELEEVFNVLKKREEKPSPAKPKREKRPRKKVEKVSWSPKRIP